VPGLGDEIQAIKAGILEIADVLVVNKADREGADRTVRDLTAMLELRPADQKGAEPVEIVRTVATNGKGIDELAKACARHRERVADGPDERRHKRAYAAVREHVLDGIRRAVDGELAARGELIDRVAARALDPYSAADELLAVITSARSRG
jgi:LAO/AO transport system kinase